MRSPALLACLAIPLLLIGCADDQSTPTAPGAPSLAAARRAPLDAGHTYRFGFTCSAAAANSLVWIMTATNIPRIGVTCNSSTELGMAYGTAFDRFDYEIALDAPGAAACTDAGITTTGTFRCKARRYTATLTVTDEGVL
jgi:hypothetical protein